MLRIHSSIKEGTTMSLPQNPLVSKRVAPWENIDACKKQKLEVANDVAPMAGSASLGQSKQAEPTLVCPVCLEQQSSRAMRAADGCSEHFGCSQCWVIYIDTQLGNGNSNSDKIECLRCSHVLEDQDMRVLSSKESYVRSVRRGIHLRNYTGH
jgi:hypothetical protein